uniref:Ecto-NOX disulfide-thiol exchanger 1/2 domain-containing protein n=1 Tax=Arion vulgaris TaxID=1028688 RepID=A0A0B7B5V8_9EUPU
MKINDSLEKEDTGRIHVDYALARDDQFEFECLQRSMAREMRHIQRLEEERLRPPSPPPVTHYSDHEASLLLEKIKADESFSKASQVLITWLERGECNRRTSTNFYSMVQNVHSHTRRLNNERSAVRDEFERYKIQFHQKVQDVAVQMCQIERVLAASHKQKCWDHFTKAQRKNIDTWQRQAQELRESEEQSTIKPDDTGDDMDFSDDDSDISGPSAGKKRKMAAHSGAHSGNDNVENQNLKEENDALKCQMEGFKNEVDMVRQEGKTEVDEKEKQLRSLQNALQGMQQQLISQRAATLKLEKENQELKSKVDQEKENTEDTDNTTASNSKDELSVTSSGLNLTDKEAKMIGLICCFLHVHPHGATVDYLWSYLRQILNVRVREVEDLLEKIPSLFQQEIVGVGAAIERRWIYAGLNRDLPATSNINNLDAGV